MAGASRGRASPSRVEPRRDEPEDEEQRRDEAPAARRGDERQEAEAPGERPEHRPAGVAGGGPADVAAHVLAAAAEEGHEQGELRPGHEGRRDDDEGGHREPPEHVAGEGQVSERPQHDREEREAVAEREAGRDGRGLEEAGRREGEERRRPVAPDERVGEAAEGDAEERRGQDQAEGEDGAAEQGREHPVPHELEQEEREAHDRTGGEDEAARGGSIGQRDGERGRR